MEWSEMSNCFSVFSAVLVNKDVEKCEIFFVMN